MSKKALDFRPSLLSEDHKGFVAALSTDEYNTRRRLVTEAALTELGSTTSAFSNYHPHGHRYRLKDITCDAEGPRRGFAVLAKHFLTGVACLAIVGSGVYLFLAHDHSAEDPQRPDVLHTGQGVHVPGTPQTHLYVRETVPDLAYEADGFSTYQAIDEIVTALPKAAELLSYTDSDSLWVTSKEDTDALEQKPMEAPVLGNASDGGLEKSTSEPKTLGSVAHNADMSSLAARAGMCTSLSTEVDVCVATPLLDGICTPSEEPLPLLQQRATPQGEDMPLQHQQLQQPELPHEQRQPGSSQVGQQEDRPPAVDQGSVDDPAPAGPGTPASFSRLEELHQTADSAQLPPLMPPPAMTRPDSIATSRLSDHIDALFASRNVKEFYGELLLASAHPQGALVMWAAVLTPLLSIFAACFVVSAALHVARAILGTLSNVCGASSHFTMQRLGQITRKLMPQTQNPPEEMVMLELQAAVAQREADCRAKDEQLASLRLLLDGLQLELQRCNDAEKDLTFKYNEALEELARVRKRHTARQSDRGRSDSSSRSTQIPGPAALEHTAPLSVEASAFSDTESDRDAAGRLHIPAAPSSASPSAVPGPPRLGRISAAAACSARSAQAQSYAVGAATPLLPDDAVSPSSDHSEAGFATCTPAAADSVSAE